MDKRIRIFNTYVDNLSMKETVAKVSNIIEEKTVTQHVVLNASKINLMEKDSQLLDIVNSCSIINADGASILWAAKQFGFSLKERVTGIDLFMNLLSLADQKKYSIYLFGAKEEVVHSVASIIQKDFPNVIISGYRNGYFTDNDNDLIVRQIAESKADMLFVAFSSPMKEYWINDHIDNLNVPFVMGVGGSFDVIAGVTKRAPLWMQNHGLEWFYRFIQEPKRMFNRYIIGNIKFVAITYKYKLGRSKTKIKNPNFK